MTYRSINPSNGVQRGAALMVMLVILVIGITTAFVTSLSTTAINNKRNQTTADALAQAKEALIGYAVTNADFPGGLPCPDLLTNIPNNNIPNDGSADLLSGSDCPSYLGRLPWKTLKFSDVRDGSGERLWYALSPNFRPQTSTPHTLNSDTPGTLNVSGNITANDIIAIIFAPGRPLSSQVRSTANGNNYQHYLESFVPSLSNFQKLTPNDHVDGSFTYNDQMVFITYGDLIPLVEKRIAREAKNCLDNYAADSNYKYPWATPVSDTSNYLGTIDTLFGRIPRTPAIQTNSASNVAGFIDALSALQFQLTQLQSALNNYSSTLPNPTQSARDGLTTAGANTKSAGDAMKNIAVSATDPITNTVADPAKKAGEKGEDAGDLAKKLAKAPPESTPAAVQSKINDSQSKINETITKLADAKLIDGTMKLAWPGSCTTFVVTYWSGWKDLMFYQVADGYKPKLDSTASCGNCLSVEGSGHNLAGSGSYRATVIIAGKKLTANRVTSNVADYLEADNLLPSGLLPGGDYTKPYKTYRVTDAAYQSVNDLVLCLDGKVNCQ